MEDKLPIPNNSDSITGPELRSVSGGIEFGGNIKNLEVYLKMQINKENFSDIFFDYGIESEEGEQDLINFERAIVKTWYKINELPQEIFDSGWVWNDKKDLIRDAVNSLEQYYLPRLLERLQQGIEDYLNEPEPVKKDMTYVDVNNMSWKEIAAARDAWINGKKIELNDSALPPIKNNGM